MRDFEADRRICGRATQGYWKHVFGGNLIYAVDENGKKPIANLTDINHNGSDGTFIAAAHAGWPKALDRIAKLEAKLAAVEKERDEARRRVEVRDRVIANHHSETLRLIHNRNEEHAHNSVLRQALEFYAEEWAYYVPYDTNDAEAPITRDNGNKARQALSATLSDSAAKVQKLVEALEWVADNDSHGYNFQNLNGFEHYEVKYGKYGDRAQKALAEWRGV